MPTAVTRKLAGLRRPTPSSVESGQELTLANKSAIATFAHPVTGPRCRQPLPLNKIAMQDFGERSANFLLLAIHSFHCGGARDDSRSRTISHSSLLVHLLCLPWCLLCAACVSGGLAV